MELTAIDHLVLTVNDIDKSIAFYTQVLGGIHKPFGAHRHAIHIGAQKINLHQKGSEFSPHAQVPTTGSADLCFLTNMSLADVVSEVTQAKVPIENGPVERTGAMGPIMSIYIRDPDDNLIEIGALIR